MKIYSIEHRFDAVVNGEVHKIYYPVAYCSSEEKAMDFIRKYDNEHVYGTYAEEELKASELVYFEHEIIDDVPSSNFEWTYIGDNAIPCLIRV